MKKKLLTLFLSILIVLVAAWAFRWYLRKTIAPKMEFNSKELILTSNKTKTTINDLKGNVVIVSFFQTWCGSCIQEMGTFNELVTTINSPNFKIICISDEDTNRIIKLQSRFYTSKILFANSSESLSSMGIYVYPTTYLLDKKGAVIQSKLEGYNWALEKNVIERLLNE